MAVETFEHEDGRTCTWSDFAQKWFHWDEDPVKGPLENHSHECDRQHPGDSHRYKVRVSPGGPSDRGEFGMPTIGGVGTEWWVGPGKIFPMELTTEVRLTEKPTTHEAIRIIGQWLPETMERFLRNNTKYARAQDVDLGAKGIMPDINRKASVLLDRIWFGADEVGEPTVEVIDDLIGHLFLLKDKIMNGEG